MPATVAGMARSQCACERTKSVTCKSSPALDLGAVIEGNCVLARGGGEQPEVNDQSVGKRTRFGLLQ